MPPIHLGEMKAWAGNEADLIAETLGIKYKAGNLTCDVDIDMLKEADRANKYPLCYRSVESKAADEDPHEGAEHVNLTQLNLLEAEIGANPLGTFDMRGFAGQKWAKEKMITHWKKSTQISHPSETSGRGKRIVARQSAAREL